MNMALAADEAMYGYGRNTSVEDAMQVLANAGYNAENWICLTAGYQVYWYDVDNRCILYNSTTAEVEYPEEYSASLMLSAADHLHIYNENHIKAQQFNMDLSSSITTNDQGKVTGNGINTSGNDVTYSISSATTQGGKTIENGNSANNLSVLASASSQNIIKASLGSASGDTVYMYATKEDISGDTSENGAYASLQISSVGIEAVLQNSGYVKENLFYLTIVGDKTSSSYSTAKKAAAQYIYNIFDQITTGKLDSDLTILIAPGTELDASSFEWAPCKTFTGYFGTTDTENPIIINGVNLSSKTGYAQTVRFDGSISKVNGVPVGSKYFVTGFFGSIYGKTTIENIKFKNLTINQPATDFSLAVNEQSRNTVAIIGAVIQSGDSTKFGSSSSLDWEEADIKLSNIKVENSSITGAASVGGLIGYIGGAGSNSRLSGSISIKDIDMNLELTSIDNGRKTTSAGYSPVGGLIGFFTRIGLNGLNISIENIKVSGTFDGYNIVSGLLGTNAEGFDGNTNILLKNNIDVSGVKFGNNVVVKAGVFATYSVQSRVKVIIDSINGKSFDAKEQVGQYVEINGNKTDWLPVIKEDRTGNILGKYEYCTLQDN